MTKDSQSRLLSVYERVYASKKTVAALRIVDIICVILSVDIFIVLICLASFHGAFDVLGLLLSAGIPFVIVSALRMFLRCKRPYELIEFSAFSVEPSHRKRGSSFPSRHVFSAFLVAVLAFEYAWYIGIIGIVLGVSLAVSRVLLGIHFIKDVVCGGAIGILSGVIGILIL